jgi:hypothetical protein
LSSYTLTRESFAQLPTTRSSSNQADLAPILQRSAILAMESEPLLVNDKCGGQVTGRLLMGHMLRSKSFHGPLLGKALMDLS